MSDDKFRVGELLVYPAHVPPAKRRYSPVKHGELLISDGADLHLNLEEAKELHRDLGAAIEWADARLKEQGTP